MIRRLAALLIALVLGLLVGTSHHADANDDLAGARQFIGDLANRSIATMTTKGISDAERTRNFRALFVQAVDLPTIGRFALGRHWRGATPEQQQEFIALFSELMVLTWSARFKDAADTVTFQVTDAKTDTDQGVAVESRILREKQAPVQVLWRLRSTEGGFRIADLVVEGTSMQFQYRDEYAAVINQGGGKIDGLLAALRQKVAQLSTTQVAN